MTATLRRMTDAIVTRGPDDEGAWTDADAGIALGHRRLSILDLSPLGHQPMASADGRYQIVFNGATYQVLSKTPWDAIDGWDAVLCVLVTQPPAC